MDILPEAYFISCPYCSQQLQVLTQNFGDFVQCPNCQRSFKVNYDVELPPMVAGAEMDTTLVEPERGFWTARNFVLALSVLLGTLILCCYGSTDRLGLN